MKQLVICADDFALHRGASEGIASLAHRGCVTATSVMVLSPRWPEDAALLQPLRGQIDVGLHLDWTSASAVEAGHGMPLPRVMLQACLGRITPEHAQRVLLRQLQAFERVWQAPPDHVDGHQHVQQFAGIRQTLVKVLAERYWQARPGRPRPYLRVSKLAPGQASLKAWIIAAMGAQPLRRLAQQSALPCAPALAGVYDFSDRAPGYAQRMNEWLRTSPSGALLMCHPAQAAGADASDTLQAARLREYQHLSGAEFQAQLQVHGVQLVRGASLYCT